LTEGEENKIQRFLGDGRKASMSHKMDIKSVQVYQKVENLKTLDTLNVKKLNYAKQFGDSWHVQPSTILQQMEFAKRCNQTYLQ
jgi:hypothetical protein